MPQPDFCPQLVGSMSTGAAGNPTVAMIEAGFAAARLNWRYINLEVAPENLAAAVKGAKAMGFRGFNCSLPHKVEVIKHLDGLGESAAVMGAVNTVVLRDGKWIGENTDGKGFLKSLQTIIDPKGKSIVLFGAGGAARAVAVELGLTGARKIVVVNRSRDRGEELSELLRSKLNLDASYTPWTDKFRLPQSTDIAVNATSIGLYDANARLDVDLDSLTARTVVADVIGNPPRTRWIVEAEARGCRTLDGLGMLVNQGLIAARYWTGIDLDESAMRQALEKALSL